MPLLSHPGSSLAAAHPSLKPCRSSLTEVHPSLRLIPRRGSSLAAAHRSLRLIARAMHHHVRCITMPAQSTTQVQSCHQAHHPLRRSPIYRSYATGSITPSGSSLRRFIPREVHNPREFVTPGATFTPPGPSLRRLIPTGGASLRGLVTPVGSLRGGSSLREVHRSGEVRPWVAQIGRLITSVRFSSPYGSTTVRFHHPMGPLLRGFHHP